MSSSGFPEALCQEILVILPVKPLLKCKCVSKSWCSLISSPDFVKSHLQLNKNKSTSNVLLLELQHYFLGDPQSMISIGYDLLESSLTTEKIAVSTMLHPFQSEVMLVTLLGSCNGLVLLLCTEYKFADSHSLDIDPGSAVCFLCVWNPATREHKKIPYRSHIDPCNYSDICIHGLCYDCKNDDYKFVIGRGTGGQLATYVDVFSLRSNSSETIETQYRFTYHEQKSGVLVNEDLHWLAEAEHRVCIVYMDSSSDVPSFKEIQLPMIPNFEVFNVGVLEEGCLCVIANNGGCADLGRVEVWEMQVYGAPQSWTRRYVISNNAVTQVPVKKLFFLKIMWSFKNGIIVLLDPFSVVFYDPKHGTAIERNLGVSKYQSEVNYVESLVSINTFISGVRTIRGTN